MQLLLPMMYQRMCELMPDIGECSVLLQKQILKILRSYLLHQLPLEHVSVTAWLGVGRGVSGTFGRGETRVSTWLDESLSWLLAFL